LAALNTFWETLPRKNSFDARKPASAHYHDIKAGLGYFQNIPGHAGFLTSILDLMPASEKTGFRHSRAVAFFMALSISIFFWASSTQKIALLGNEILGQLRAMQLATGLRCLGARETNVTLLSFFKERATNSTARMAFSESSKAISMFCAMGISF